MGRGKKNKNKQP